MVKVNGPITPVVVLTDEQREAIVDFVQFHGRARARVWGTDFNEADYLAGAMSVFFALGQQDRMPASWVFGPMSGRSPLGLDQPHRALDDAEEGA